MTVTADQVTNEIRRPMLVKWAKELGIEVNASDLVSTIKESLMTKLAAPAKPAPAKPAAAPPKPAPAPAKPAAVAPPKPAPAKPAPAAPKAPAAAPAKPGAPPAAAKAPAAAPKPTAVEKDYYTKAETENLLGQVMTYCESLEQRITLIQYGPFVTLDENGGPVLDFENADEPTLLNWQWTFGIEGGTAEEVRANMKKAKASKKWNGWIVVNEGPRPTSGDAAPAAEEEAPAEEEEEGITAEQIEAMNWTQLAELADRCQIEYKDLATPTQKPKALRKRILEALAAAQEGGEEEGSTELAEGAAVVVTIDGEQYPAVFNGASENEGMVVVTWDANQEQAEVPFDSLSLPG